MGVYVWGQCDWDSWQYHVHVYCQCDGTFSHYTVFRSCIGYSSGNSSTKRVGSPNGVGFWESLGECRTMPTFKGYVCVYILCVIVWLYCSRSGVEGLEEAEKNLRLVCINSKYCKISLGSGLLWNVLNEMIVQCKLVPVVGSHYAVGCFGCGLCLFAVGGAVKVFSGDSETSWLL